MMNTPGKLGVVKWLIAALLLTLLALIVIKPRVENGFHTAYLANLSDMEALSGELQRDHLLVRQGLVQHYDYLEADLEMMERAAELAALMPGFVGRRYREQSAEYLEQYSAAVVSLRKHVDDSKRSIGLLNNARMAFRMYLGELNDQFSLHINEQTGPLLIQLNHALAYQELDAKWLEKAEQLQSISSDAAVVIKPLSLHARMILVQQDNLAESTRHLYTALGKMNQPEKLRTAYLEQYYASVSMTNALLWGSYAIVGVLLFLCGVLTISSRKAQEKSEGCTRVAEKAWEDSEYRVQETQRAVSLCNEALARIGKGDFGHRLEGSFVQELELLRSGINDTADSVEFTMLELTRVMQAIQQGRFDVRLDPRVQGDFGQQVDETIATLDKTIGNICLVMDDMRGGCFGARVDVECSGRLEELKHAVNSSMMVMEGAITAVVDVAKHQSRGDFSRQIENDGKGQIELLTQSINATSSKVHEMVQQIRQVSTSVADSSDSMQVNTRRLLEHTNSHSDSLIQLLERVDLVKGSIQTNRDSVQLATTLVDRSREAAEDGNRIANEAIGFMHDINEKSQQIASTTQVLDTIAKQTNMLALNAAVEAARAGVHGSGFSVVANEVKELARQSAEASTHITALIQATSNDIRLGAESVTSTGQALQNIGQSISDVEQATHTIVNESRQQEKGMDTIVEIVGQSRVLMDSDVTLADTNRETSVFLGELAHRVNELLAFFKAGDIEPGIASAEGDKCRAVMAESTLNKAA